VTSAEPAQAAAAAVLDGTGLTCAKVRKIAGDGQRSRSGTLDTRTADRPLDADIDPADRLLPGLGAS